MGTRIALDKGKSNHVHSFATMKIIKTCDKCNAPKRVKEKCLVPGCDKVQKSNMKCKCG